MTEAMAIEKLAEEYARSCGYLTENRIPCKYKNKSNPGDIDVLCTKDSQLVAIEVKGYLSPEDYCNWCTTDYLHGMYDIVEKLTTQIETIRSERWQSLFHTKKRFDEVWIVASGFFSPTLELRESKHDTVNPCIYELNNLLVQSNKPAKENDYIKIIEKHLSGQNTRVKVIPIHTLIERLILFVKKDMVSRRTRYPDTALEAFRWIIRAVEHNRLNLCKLQEELNSS